MTFILAFGVDKRAVRNRDLAAGKVTNYCGLDRDCPSKVRELHVLGLEPSTDKCNNHVRYAILSVVT